MKKVLAGAVIALASVLIYKSCTDDREQKSILEENSMLIQQELRNVAKLVVSEGHFAEVYNYKDSKELFGPLVTAHKKALVVVNANVSIAYDMSKINYELDEANKLLKITQIPEPEIKISPDFEYYDVTVDYLNPFNAGDYNAIKRNVNASLMKKIEASSLRSNAENRLVSELSRILVLTNTMGWTLVYENTPVENTEQLKTFLD
ncbi:DUF4230 domain-containing protein [Flagellimonas halotolerans]|uniref:DUF4230 domain-containing protein n=1 Tax=Flagellimonas halotolerans TaxID=3112164 RepID=A0ABU6ITF4_9FLAO|nr:MULTISPECIES: DUF4230 domain-containing protein [unclassified Allomuricauda]MEC3966502.1 DUF4230 domain-containing protein [Muricauda sp. SYSU M86414]MEC4266361.1 DUF4230 domain-containing protein [Muricauda sp. SYSU M84420]